FCHPQDLPRWCSPNASSPPLSDELLCTGELQGQEHSSGWFIQHLEVSWAHSRISGIAPSLLLCWLRGHLGTGTPPMLARLHFVFLMSRT
uniref:Uncharacterized protein n=1 Tax=Cyanoderma ruficeps TaxID=181631 RepID=A0A8C3X5C4_9PASS